jgi:hypothetical protein
MGAELVLKMEFGLRVEKRLRSCDEVLPRLHRSGHRRHMLQKFTMFKAGLDRRETQILLVKVPTP